MSRPLLLDLYCSAGGAAKGYHDAGFDIIGVDIVPQPHYPFPIVIMDALEYLDTQDLSKFTAIHASPECKGYTNCNLSPKHLYKTQIGDVRERLQRIGKPYIIENVAGAQREMINPLMLCGSMFGLRTRRHRFFESNVFLLAPGRGCDHRDTPIAVYGHSVWDSSKEGTARKDGRRRPDSVPVQVGRDTMRIPWMNMNELAEAIPPAYTEFLGWQLIGA